jgi:hypothetical protein
MKSLTELSDEFDSAVAQRKDDESAINILNESLKFGTLIRRIQDDCHRLHIEFDNEKLCRREEYRMEIIKQIEATDRKEVKDDAVYHKIKEGVL